MKTMLWFLVFTLALCLSVSAEVKLPAVFGDHMVLQRSSAVTVWGWAEPAEKITVKGSWQGSLEASATTDKDGNWRVRLDTPVAGGPYTLSVKGSNELVLKDILIGEVWVCSGQSNMERSLDRIATKESKAAIETADHPHVRLFTVPQIGRAHV